MGGIARINFWCARCRKDWALTAEKVWLNSAVKEAWIAHCPDCSRRLVRLRDVMAMHDPYFRQSRFIKASMRKHIDSLVQIGDSRFDMLYPQHKKQREEFYENEERKKYDEKTH